MKINMICDDCDEIFKPTGIAQARCPKCGSFGVKECREEIISGEQKALYERAMKERDNYKRLYKGSENKVDSILAENRRIKEECEQSALLITKLNIEPLNTNMASRVTLYQRNIMLVNQLKVYEEIIKALNK